ncbi:MAG: hypothetical protein SXU28_05100 [Pseudomonadota bacterium]|nr:hypothetical protein [Pseudomonadota bacterium]
MTNTFEKIRISYQQHSETGLLCAFSDDLKGLVVFGRTPTQLYEKIPDACADLVEAISGERYDFRWTDESQSERGGFAEPKASLGDLVPA